MENDLKLDKFFYNVIDYLYNDVTKFDHGIIFETTKVRSADSLYQYLEALKASDSKETIESIFKISFESEGTHE